MRALAGWRRVITATLSVAAAVAAPSVAAADRLPLADSHLYYEVHGTGRPLVLIHGGNLDAGMWDEDVPVLAKTFRVVTYDVRPYGRSGPATPDYAWHEDLRALLDHLKIERADLVGLSLGARLAINFALAYPSRVDRLVLAGPGVDGWPFAPDPQLAALIAAAKARDATQATALWLQHPYMAPAMRDPAVATRCGDSPRATSTSGCSRSARRWCRRRQPSTGCARSARRRWCWSARSTWPTSRASPSGWRRTSAGRASKVLDGVGHMINLEAPERFRALVTDFLSNR